MRMNTYLKFFFECLFQEANKRNNSVLPPPWAIAAMLVLGFNEFMTLLRYLTCIFDIQSIETL